jgi:hypothetical protein
VSGWAWNLLHPIQWQQARRYSRTHGLRSNHPPVAEALRRRAAGTTEDNT